MAYVAGENSNFLKLKKKKAEGKGKQSCFSPKQERTQMRVEIRSSVVHQKEITVIYCIE